MPKKYSDEEYAKMLPKKQVGTAVLFLDEGGNLLVVKPDYKDKWLVPGGSADENESPLECAIREVREEIGLEFTTLKLIGIYYGRQTNIFNDSLKFIYFGGILAKENISKIVLQETELEELKFLPVDEAISLLSNSLQNSIPAALTALNKNTVAYIE